MPKINFFWMAHSDQVLIVPSLRITIETIPQWGGRFKHTKCFVIGFEIGFLKRWCAVEMLITRKEESHA